MRASVDFPLPDSPTIPIASFLPRLSETLRTASTRSDPEPNETPIPFAAIRSASMALTTCPRHAGMQRNDRPLGASKADGRHKYNRPEQSRTSPRSDSLLARNLQRVAVLQW